MIGVEDIGKYGLIAFEQHDKLNGEAIDIAGDAKTMPETAEILGKAMGKSVTFVQVPIEEVRKFSEDFAIMLEWFDRVGYEVDIPSRRFRAAASEPRVGPPAVPPCARALPLRYNPPIQRVAPIPRRPALAANMRELADAGGFGHTH
jgi:hypothetical protein